MLVEKHLFDLKSRVSAEEAGAMELVAWQPPVINSAGHLVHAESRPPQKLVSSNSEEEVANAAPSVTEQEVFDEAKTRGYQEGLTQGKQAGEQQAKQEAQQQMQEQLQPKLQEMNRLMTTLSHSLNEEDYKLEQTLLTLVRQTAEAVIGHELKTDPGQIMKVIRETLAALPPNRDHISIRLHPADKSLVEDAIKEGGENWHAIADDDIERGGCVIETDQSTADFSIEDRLASVFEQLMEQQATAPKPGDPDYEEAPLPAISARSIDANASVSAADHDKDEDPDSVEEGPEDTDCEPKDE